MTARRPWDRKGTEWWEADGGSGTDLQDRAESGSHGVQLKVSGNLEMWDALWYNLQTWERRLRSAWVAGLFWIRVCVSVAEGSTGQEQSWTKSQPALPNIKPPFYKWHGLLTSKQAVNSRKFPFFMPFFKICYHFKRSLSGAGLHKQITCEREKNHIQGKAPRWEPYFRALPERGRAALSPTDSPVSVLHLQEPFHGTAAQQAETEAPLIQAARALHRTRTSAEVSIIQHRGGKPSLSEGILNKASAPSDGTWDTQPLFLQDLALAFSVLCWQEG